jgi:hypothetical protein
MVFFRNQPSPEKQGKHSVSSNHSAIARIF